MIAWREKAGTVGADVINPGDTVSGSGNRELLSAAYKLGVIVDVRKSEGFADLSLKVRREHSREPFLVTSNWSPSLWEEPDFTMSPRSFRSEREALPLLREILGSAEETSGLTLRQMLAETEMRRARRAGELPEPLAQGESDPAVAPCSGLSGILDEDYPMELPFCSHGHLINGHMNVSRYRTEDGREARERIVVDISRDARLRDAVLKTASMKLRYDASLSEGEKRAMLLVDAFNVVEEGIRSNKEAFEGLDRIMLGDAFVEGGACRHKGLASALILEQMVLQGNLGGRVYYVRGPAHGWAVYRTREGEFIVFDPAQKDKPINIASPEAHYARNGERIRYDCVREWRQIIEWDRELEARLSPQADTVFPDDLTVDPSALKRSGRPQDATPHPTDGAKPLPRWRRILFDLTGWTW